MGTAQDNTKDDEIELMREMKPADLDRLQRDLEEGDRGDQITDQRPGGKDTQ